MIDRKAAVQMAKDEGCRVMQLVVDREGTRSAPTIIASAEQIKALITRAQNEAFEQAAQLFDKRAKGGNLHKLIHSVYAQEIRALKHEP